MSGGRQPTRNGTGEEEAREERFDCTKSQGYITSRRGGLHRADVVMPIPGTLPCEPPLASSRPIGRDPHEVSLPVSSRGARPVIGRSWYRVLMGPPAVILVITPCYPRGRSFGSAPTQSCRTAFPPRRGSDSRGSSDRTACFSSTFSQAPKTSQAESPESKKPVGNNRHCPAPRTTKHRARRTKGRQRRAIGGKLPEGSSAWGFRRTSGWSRVGRRRQG